VRRDRTSPAKQGKHREYMDLLSSLDSPYGISGASMFDFATFRMTKHQGLAPEQHREESLTIAD
jgi:hypothetical protein